MTAPRIRLAAAAALIAAVAIAGVLALTGSSEGGGGRLAWKGEPSLLRSGPDTDRILYGQVETASVRTLDLDVKDARVLDEDGKELKSSVIFLAAFAHGLFPASQKPEVIGDPERRRLGQIATLKPGQTLPLTVSWRVPEGGKPPVRVDFGSATLPLPASAAR